MSAEFSFPFKSTYTISWNFLVVSRRALFARTSRTRVIYSQLNLLKKKDAATRETSALSTTSENQVGHKH